jgi:hypothetical protein
MCYRNPKSNIRSMFDLNPPLGSDIELSTVIELNRSTGTMIISRSRSPRSSRSSYSISTVNTTRKTLPNLRVISVRAISGGSSASTGNKVVDSARIKIRVDAGIELIGNVRAVGTSVGASGIVSRSKAAPLGTVL